MFQNTIQNILPTHDQIIKTKESNDVLKNKQSSFKQLLNAGWSFDSSDLQEMIDRTHELIIANQKSYIRDFKA
eukprot:Pgem_evm1s16841